MKKLLSLIPLFTLLFSSCIDNRQVNVIDIRVDNTYLIDQTGPFSQSGYIGRAIVMDQLNLPLNGIFENVKIESISAQVIMLADNQASAIMLSGSVEKEYEKILAFSNYAVPLTIIDPDTPYVGINALVDTGVQRIQSYLQEIILGHINGFNIVLKGDSTPTGGKRVHAQIKLRITGSVKYTRCVSTPYFLIDEPC